MKRRKLGNQGLEVSALGLGCLGMSFPTADEEESITTIGRALDLGITLFNTADFYGDGDNEKLLGRALAGRHEQPVIATKTGVRAEVEEGTLREKHNGRPAYLRQACDASLSRLGVDEIDLYTLARVDPEVPIEESVGAMGELVQAGKVRFVGLSEAAPETIRRAHAEHPITSLETEYSLWSRRPEDGVLPTCRELGIGFVAYSPLGRGFLTGQFQQPEDITDARRRFPRFQGENFYKNLELVGAVKQMAGEKGITPAQLALAWLLARGEEVVPIPGTTSGKHLEENARATEITFTEEELTRLDEIAPQGVAAGERYPEESMQYVRR